MNATLYSDVPDKQCLFFTMLRTECDRPAGAAPDLIEPTSPAETMLKAAPRHIVPNLLSEISQSVFRICLVESDRPQDLGMAYRCSDALAQRERVRRGGAGEGRVAMIPLRAPGTDRR